LGKGKISKDLKDAEDDTDRNALRRVLNHYEFIATGLRNGDFDERLVRDSERAAILTLFEKSQDFIWNLRDARRRITIYENIEWLYSRWEKSPPSHMQQCAEWIVGRPFPGRRANPRQD
jgi:hypothetical protein